MAAQCTRSLSLSRLVRARKERVTSPMPRTLTLNPPLTLSSPSSRGGTMGGGLDGEEDGGAAVVAGLASGGAPADTLGAGGGPASPRPRPDGDAGSAGPRAVTLPPPAPPLDGWADARARAGGGRGALRACVRRPTSPPPRAGGAARTGMGSRLRCGAVSATAGRTAGRGRTSARALGVGAAGACPFFSVTKTAFARVRFASTPLPLFFFFSASFPFAASTTRRPMSAPLPCL